MFDEIDWDLMRLNGILVDLMGFVSYWVCN